MVMPACRKRTVIISFFALYIYIYINPYNPPLDVFKRMSMS